MFEPVSHPDQEETEMKITPQIQDAIDAEIAFRAASATDPQMVYAETARLHRQANDALKGMTRTQIKFVMDTARSA